MANFLKNIKTFVEISFTLPFGIWFLNTKKHCLTKRFSFATFPILGLVLIPSKFKEVRKSNDLTMCAGNSSFVLIDNKRNFVIKKYSNKKIIKRIIELEQDYFFPHSSVLFSSFKYKIIVFERIDGECCNFNDKRYIASQMSAPSRNETREYFGLCACHKCYVQHGDFYLKNIFKKENNFYAIDLDTIDFYPPYYDLISLMGIESFLKDDLTIYGVNLSLDEKVHYGVCHALAYGKMFFDLYGKKIKHRHFNWVRRELIFLNRIDLLDKLEKILFKD